MITIALVEDDEAQHTALSHVVERFFSQNNEEIQLLTYTDGDNILNRYPQHLDLILMDIDMPKVDGLEAARRIRRFDTQVLLVFVTNMVQCALEGYAVEAMDFIVKPVTDTSCELSFSRILRRLRQRRGHSIQVRRGKNTYSIDALELLYAETQGHSLLLHMRDGSTMPITESIQSLTQRTQHLGFFRCHTSFLVNLAAVDTIRQKHHDMKNYLLALRAGQESQPAVAQLAVEIEQLMRPLESTLNTGNEFLDVILAEKITLCQQKEIELTPFADGQKLSFIDGLDLCVIVGNALDNAIEAVEDLPAERRVIHLKLCPVRDMILFTVQNYYRSQPQKDSRGFYRTSKGDTENHGYGLKGISLAVEKYGGTLATSADGTSFTLSVLIPMPEASAT